MKKLLFLTLAMAFVANFALAQTPKEIKASQDRVAKITKLQEMPKPCDISSIDELTKLSNKIAIESMTISKGLSDAAAKKLSLEKCVTLSKSIAKQAINIKNVSTEVPKVSGELKSIKNPMKLKKATSNVKYITNTVALTTEESVYQTKSIAGIIETLKK